MKYRALLGFLLLAVLVASSDATLYKLYNESDLQELYDNAARLYRDAKYHWDMSSGYNDMLGEPGMKICFVEGPELEALVLGGEVGNISSNVTLQLQDRMSSVSIPDPQRFTVALWYSFRPIDFFSEINDTMACDLLQLGGGSGGLTISYNGKKEYNLKYQYHGEINQVIDDDENRPNWEFEVNDTVTGELKRRGWQWNHIALVVDAGNLVAYYNGFEINKTTEISTPDPPTTTTDPPTTTTRAANLMLNVAVDGKTPCGPVGFDEVTMWDKPLNAEDILALRVHVGRNRSLDEPEPTTEAATTESGIDDTTAGDSTIEDTTAGDTTAGDTTAGDTTAGDTTAGDTTAGDTTASATTADASDSTAESSTLASTDGQPMDGSVISTGGKTSTRGPTSTARPVISTPSPEEKKIENLIQNVTMVTTPDNVVKVLTLAIEIVDDASATQTLQIADNVVALLDKSSSVPPANENSSSETIAALNDYRKAFVNLFSSVLVQWDQIEEPVQIAGADLVQIMDNFLTKYVADPTVAKNESIFSNGVDVQLAPANASKIQMDVNTSVTIPGDAFDFATKGVKIVICLLKKGLQNVLEPKGDKQPTDLGRSYSVKPTWNISGPIILLKIAGRTGSVKLKRQISFEMQVDPTLGDDPACVYQNKGSWSGEGVSRSEYKKDCPCVVCKTTHLTNFAVLMAVDGVLLEGPHAVLLSIVSYIGCGLSLFCLIIALILFIILRELNSTRMGIVKNLCVALFFAQLLFVSGIETAKVNSIACKAVAAMLHYFFLCVIAWMLCNGIYLYLKVQRACRPGSVVDLIYFCILGWGAPAIVVAITAGINHEVYGTPNLCWLSTEGAGIWAFVAPAMAIILFNALVTFLTMKAFVSVKVFKDKSDKDKIKSGLRAIVVMLPILGLSWIFGLLAFGEAGILFQYLFAIFNSLQGVFLFIFHVLLNDEVKGAMRRRFGKVGASGGENMLFNKIWAFSSSGPEKSTEVSSVTKFEKKPTKPVYKN